MTRSRARTVAGTTGTGDDLQPQRTRTGTAWTGAAIGAVLVLLMLVFILQNTHKARMNFLWMHFTIPLGAGLLLAGVLGALIVILLGVGRMLQLRLAARRHRETDHVISSAPPAS